VIPVFMTVGGVGMLLLTGLSARLGQRVHPAHRARLLLGGLLTSVLVFEAGLLLWSAPVVLDLVGFIDLAAVCRRVLGGPTPGGTATGLLAGVAAAWVGAAVVAGWWRVVSTQRRLRFDASMTPLERGDAFDLYVLSAPRRMAYTVGGRRPQVVVTSAVIEGLSAGSVDVILAHERVHALNKHHRFLAAAAATETAVGWIPPVGNAVHSVRLCLERWADEDAARVSAGGRSDVKSVLISACLGTTPGVAGFGGFDMVSERISGLDGPAPGTASRWVTSAYLAYASITVASMLTVAWASRLSVLALTHPGQCLV
jgi:hypothetical protein